MGIRTSHLLVGCRGFEPRPYGLKVRHATITPTSHLVLRGGVEPPSKPYKDSALTVVLTEYMYGFFDH